MLSLHKYFHWLYYSRNKRNLFNFGSGLFFWLFLAVTQPFGLYNSNVSDLILFALLLPIGLFWVGIVYSEEFIASKVFKVSIDTSIKSDIILWIIKMVSFIHLLYILRGLLCDWQCVDAFEYLQLWFAIPIMFGFCYFPFALYARSVFFQDIVIEGPQNNSDLTFPGIGNEKLSIKINQVAYLKADDNYVDLFLIDDDGIQSKVPVRSTLATFETKLTAFSQFVRIHRSYIINIGFFTSFSKGNNTVSLTIGKSAVELPVSRKYKNRVSTLFTSPKV